MKMPGTDSPFDYVKIGPYVEALGGLKSEKTNQRLYKRVEDKWEDITSSFWKKSL
jgi:anaerobic ribonucleoside-triphosphate reductase activating protein